MTSGLLDDLPEERLRELRKQIYPENGGLNQHTAAEEINELADIITLRDTEETYLYRDGTYQPAETHLKEFLHNVLMNKASRSATNEIISSVKISTYIDREELNQPSNIINVKNGLVDVETGTHREHDPDYHFFKQLPVKYDPDQDCPVFRQFLEETLHSSDIPIIQEMFGYALVDHYKYHKAFFFHGPGSNGKSTLLNVLENLLGTNCVSNANLREITENKFAPADLHNMKANISTELDENKMHKTSIFKKLTGDDTIRAEKKYQNPFEFKNHATLIFALNKYPRFNEFTDAVTRRVKAIDFPNKFTEDPDDCHKTKNPEMVDNLTTDEELSGILNWAIEGYRRLEEQQSFTKTKTSKQAKINCLYENNTAQAFIENHIQQKSGRKVLKEWVFDEYKDFCHSLGKEPVTKNVFWRKMNEECQFDERHPLRDGEQTKVCHGIHLTNLDFGMSDPNKE